MSNRLTRLSHLKLNRHYKRHIRHLPKDISKSIKQRIDGTFVYAKIARRDSFLQLKNNSKTVT